MIEAQAIKESARIIVEAAMELLYKDGHHWSERPRPTCNAITSLIGKDFGCVRYRKEREAARAAKGE